jgi:hypothetical protein
MAEAGLTQTPEALSRRRTYWFWIAAVLGFGAGLFFFYIRYVPHVAPYECVLLPWVIGACGLAALTPRWGTFFFLFSFPLINNLPYYFGLDESFAQAPAALVLFLFFFLGLLIRRTYAPGRIVLDNPVFKPGLLFCGLVLVSALITIFRFTNFFPLLSDGIYDLYVSVINVTAGAGIMTSISYALSYLSAFAFFYIAWRFFADPENVRWGFRILFASMSLALAFGLYQQLADMTLGNSPLRYSSETINATFKDPNSFGACLAMLIPLSAGLFFSRRLPGKILGGSMFVAIVFLLPYTGSGSGLFGIGASLAVFLGLAAFWVWKKRAAGTLAKRTLVFSGAIIASSVILIAGSLIVARQSMLFYKISQTVVNFKKGSSFDIFLHRRWSVNWEDGLAMTRDYPFTGVGIGAYTVEVPNYAELAKKSLPIGESAENYAIQVVSEMGALGLLLSLWVLGALLKQVKCRLAGFSSAGKDIFLLFGAVGAMASYLVNIQFHTYIGSYEVKYLFWMVAALALRLPGAVTSPPERESRTGFFTKRRWAAAAVILFILFAALHLWNSTHSLSIASRTRIFHLKQYIGLYSLEKTAEGTEFRWTRSYGGVPVKIENSVVEISLHAAHPDIRRRPVRVTIELVTDFFKTKKVLGEITLRSEEWGTYRFSVADAVGQEAILLLKVSRTWNPLQVTGAPDPRDLGVAVGPIRFRDSLAKPDPTQKLAR